MQAFRGLFEATKWLELKRHLRTAQAKSLLGIWVAVGVVVVQAVADGAEAPLVVYDFSEGQGDRVFDRSGAEGDAAIDLKIWDPKAVKWGDGSLTLSGATLLRSERPARRVVDAVREAQALTVEAWVEPADAKQEGPARLLTLSKSTSERYVTLGQEGDRWDVRFRSAQTNRNGQPSVASERQQAKAGALTHLVYSRHRDGRALLYVNGVVRGEGRIQGDLAPWKDGFHLALGNEHSGDRAWKGVLHRVALYDRAFDESEVAARFEAGTAGLDHPRAADPVAENHQLFTQRIAPLLATHCLECHDAGTREGKLDLSTRKTAFAEKGTLFPGNAHDSLLWETVASDEMPEDREPLSAEEKQWLKNWIDGGAHWPDEIAVIDPAIYARAPAAAGNWVPRLTVDEYIATVQATLGVDVAEEARQRLPPDLRADGFRNTAYNLKVDLEHVKAYASLAELAVDRLDVKAFTQRFGKNRDLADDKKMKQLLADLGKWVLRGPLNEEELFLYRGITTSVAAGGGEFEDAMAFVVEAMLQSPRFLYRMERQVGGGANRRAPVSPYELASRMSYLIWGASPDEALYRAAEKGGLNSEAQVREQIDRMLEDPRAVKRSKHFVSDWLDLPRLGHLEPSREKFPDWDPALAGDMRDETLAFFEEVVWNQERPLGDLLNAQLTYLTPRLARHYRLPQEVVAEIASKSKSDTASAGPDQKPALVKVDLSDIASRGGLLTQGSVLTIGGDEASMVTRGLFVFNDLLRGTVRNPPPDLDTSPIATKPGLSHRGAAEQRISRSECRSCHEKFEPLAFGLEKFDGLGAFHEQDSHGNRLREDGELRIPGEAEARTYRSAAALMDLLASSDRVVESLTWKVGQFALGRPLTAEDAPELQRIHASAQKEGGRYRDLMRALLLSDLVRQSRRERATDKS